MNKAYKTLAISIALIASLITTPLAKAQEQTKAQPTQQTQVVQTSKAEPKSKKSSKKRKQTSIARSSRNRRSDLPLASRHLARPRQVTSDYYEIEVKVTAYTPHHEYGGGNHTATGHRVQEGVVAVDPRIIPLYTKLWVPGYGECIALDTGGMIKGNHIDVAFGSQSEVRDWGTKRLTIKVYRKKDRD